VAAFLDTPTPLMQEPTTAVPVATPNMLLGAPARGVSASLLSSMSASPAVAPPIGGMTDAQILACASAVSLYFGAPVLSCRSSISSSSSRCSIKCVFVCACGLWSGTQTHTHTNICLCLLHILVVVSVCVPGRIRTHVHINKLSHLLNLKSQPSQW
jgi:hypothetical protein